MAFSSVSVLPSAPHFILRVDSEFDAFKGLLHTIEKQYVAMESNDFYKMHKLPDTDFLDETTTCLLYTSPSPRDA